LNAISLTTVIGLIARIDLGGTAMAWMKLGDSQDDCDTILTTWLWLALGKFNGGNQIRRELCLSGN